MPLDSVHACVIGFIQGESSALVRNISTKQLASGACNEELGQEGEELLKSF